MLKKYCFEKVEGQCSEKLLPVLTGFFSTIVNQYKQNLCFKVIKFKKLLIPYLFLL